MSDLLAVALVCASTVAAGDCNRTTAVDVTVMPVNSAYECALGAQATMATGLVGEGSYLKILCERRRVAQASSPAD